VEQQVPVRVDRKGDIIAVSILTVVLLVAFFLYGTINWQIEPYVHWDLSQYITMAQAENVSDCGAAKPYCYRWLAPLLAKWMPLDVVQSFRVLTLLFCGGLTYLFYAFLRSRSFSWQVSLVVSILIILNKYLFGLLVWDYFQLVDVIGLVLIVGMLWAIEARAWLVFGVLLVFGAATKETCMLLIPVALISLWQAKEPEKKVYACCACIPGILIFVLVRILTHSAGGLDLFEAFRTHAPKILQPEKLAKMFVNIWVPISLLPFLCFGSTLQFFRKHLPYLVFVALVYVSVLFGTDTERLVAPAGVVVFWLMAYLLEHNLRHPVFHAVLIGSAVISSFHQEIGRFPLPSQKYTLALALGSLVLVSSAAFFCRHKPKTDIPS